LAFALEASWKALLAFLHAEPSRASNWASGDDDLPDDDPPQPARINTTPKTADHFVNPEDGPCLMPTPPLDAGPNTVGFLAGA
jgi:hypothetical protein